MTERGHAVATFHHLANKAAAGPTPTAVPSGRPAWQRQLWRLLPAVVRAWLVAANDEIRYARAIARQIDAAAGAQKPALSDRYVYDRLVDLRLHGRGRHQIAAVWAACRLMRKPTMTFLLTDAPDRIHARKAELSIGQIEQYQRDLKSLFVRLGVPYNEIDVAGRPAETVARDVVSLIQGGC